MPMITLLCNIQKAKESYKIKNARKKEREQSMKVDRQLTEAADFIGRNGYMAMGSR